MEAWRGMGKKRYLRFADVPGISYQPIVSLTDFKLPGGGKSLASSYYTPPPMGGRSPKEIRSLLAIALELPGTVYDYHSILQDSQEELWLHRKKEPLVLVDVERLCLWDIMLGEKYRDVDMRSAPTSLTPLPSFHRLIRLYEREGYLREAMQIALRAEHYCKGDHFYKEQLQPRLAALEAEGETATL